MPDPYLFAYGFLMSVFHGNEQTQTPPLDARLLGLGTYDGLLYRVASYPGVIYRPEGDKQVYGEVFWLNHPNRTLPILDEYEHASPLITNAPEYARRLRPIRLEGKTIQCWVYEYLGTVQPDSEIKSGKFDIEQTKQS
ncbi:gamma-glutamylcyclotransferase (GGCT)/AIG2-like uncharacterized protein YtfP [Marinoscillum furvescens DSM 4134]|uniref:Gamma-glutamylcyclotransferase (GGCT)/AIG2-like uncharacterized protein YtfP n=2 Tax=Marinoscillum furvescens TaxID=1026 RepID=A0A3D9L224_MARFU|nr:gamma-glutamylcyclotransferase (GGCT)/AIG2-like uncharacterized protein YtfP [Marinoscillum furvescens DSM 4134]